MNTGNKSGPNGPSLLTAHYDALALKGHPISNVISYFLELFQTPESFLFKGIQDVGSSEPGNRNRISKLAFLSEWGGKTRTIAIGDYWSQQALKPIHKAFMRLLGTFDTDGT